MSRAVDAVQILNDINKLRRPTPVSQFESGVNDGLNQAMWVITHAPTLTPQNEPLPVLVNDEPGREYIDYICPKCRNIISQRRRGQRMETVYQCKYHDNCGQRVDWTNPQPLPPPGKDNNVPTKEQNEPERAGLYGKYTVHKNSDGSLVTDCFILRPAKDPAAVAALRAYAAATDNAELAADIINWVGAELNKPLKDWTLGEIKQECEKHPGACCIKRDCPFIDDVGCVLERVTGDVPPYMWELPESPRWIEEDETKAPDALPVQLDPGAYMPAPPERRPPEGET